MHLCANNEQYRKEIKKIVPFTLASKRIEYLGINLTKEAKDFYLENCKILLKEVKKTSCVCGLEDLILLWYQYSQIDLHIQSNSYKNSSDVFAKNREVYPNVHMDPE